MPAEPKLKLKPNDLVAIRATIVHVDEAGCPHVRLYGAYTTDFMTNPELTVAARAIETVIEPYWTPGDRFYIGTEDECEFGSIMAIEGGFVWGKLDHESTPTTFELSELRRY